jgi:hypothetical protein
MNTWVLVLVIFAYGKDAAKQPISMIAIPGYRTELDCKAAAGAMVDVQMLAEYMTVKCIPGPAP